MSPVFIVEIATLIILIKTNGLQSKSTNGKFIAFLRRVETILVTSEFIKPKLS